MLKRGIEVTWDVISRLLTSAVIGCGIGFVEGEILARSWERSAQIAFAEGAADLGILAGLVLGPVFYLLLSRTISFHESQRSLLRL